MRFGRKNFHGETGGIELPVVAMMLMLLLGAIIAFDGLTREPTLEIQITAFIGILLITIDAIASGTSSMRDRRALLTLSWGVTFLIVIVIAVRIVLARYG